MPRPSLPSLFVDPLALSAGAPSRLLLAALITVGLWAAVAWAMAA